MNPHFPLHVQVLDHCTSVQRIGIIAKLVQPICTRQQLPNPTLATIYSLSLGKGDAQQRCRMIVVCFQGQIRGLQLRNTIETHSTTILQVCPLHQYQRAKNLEIARQT